MKNNNITTLILISLLSVNFLFSENKIYEIIERYENGDKKTQKITFQNDQDPPLEHCIEKFYQNGNKEFYGCYIGIDDHPWYFHEYYHENGNVKKIKWMVTGQENIYDKNGNIVQKGFDFDKVGCQSLETRN